jgi:aromatic-amino-acid transaminase
MSLFTAVEMAPRDPILGLTEQYNADTNPKKVNLGVGVYYDDNGKLPLLQCVQKAEEKMMAAHAARGYLPIDGIAAYDAAVKSLVFGAESEPVKSGRVATVQGLGGTGALRVGADFLKKLNPSAKVLISDPSWENHRALFTQAGFQVETYPYYDAAKRGINFDGMLTALNTAPAGTVVVLHACCHNPTGYDLTPRSGTRWWRREGPQAGGLPRHGLPGLRPGHRRRRRRRAEVRGLRRELLRLHLLLQEPEPVRRARRRAVGAVPGQGRAGPRAVAAEDHDPHQLQQPADPRRQIAATILNTPELRALWEQELAGMRVRIKQMRVALVDKLKAAGVKQDMSFITQQVGMFSYSGLTKDQMVRLRDEFGVYGWTAAASASRR